MRLLPRSLSGRLLVTAAVTIAVALLLAAFAIGHVLERFVMAGLDDRLDAQIAIVARAVEADGRLDAAKAIDLPPFDQPGSGWAWEVIGPAGTLRSASLRGGDLPLPRGRDWSPFGRGDERHGRIRQRPHPLEGVDTEGRAIHYRIATLPTLRGDAIVLAAGPRAIVDRPLRAAMLPLLLSVILLAGFLALALIVQLRIGLRPLVALRQRVIDVRAGRIRHIRADEPTELLPLVEELNALIDANEQALERARGHVANLAHGLKTPLATLKLDLARFDAAGEGRLRAQVERMEGQIRHHLSRARAAEAGIMAGRQLLAPRLHDLAAALSRIHADRAIVPLIAVDATIGVQCDAQDLDEMLGNILDNAWQHAKRTVRVKARAVDRMIRIEIDDDGPGLPPDRISDLNVARRLDERATGYGFGIAIARELAELHGGTLTLRQGDLGGLAVDLNIPDRGP
ncbi:sensor histidine kinase [Sphingomonas immobilis]|uniref:histidine kinase n=1 Tax=Sphingomonas immobilis TaxID=3063997 RepID=A0ABT9A0R0_9SPHN|nr:HAMP domain-containing sensor histidine kinase [Sphingomonas sp. CA1-15]MDO7843417.1 HAMP domain-containing sensor histidine kinase [Sphingomonas sp. CA1-15]